MYAEPRLSRCPSEYLIRLESLDSIGEILYKSFTQINPALTRNIWFDRLCPMSAEVPYGPESVPTPREVISRWHTRWQDWDEVVVPPYSGTAEQTAEIHQAGERILYVPRQTTTPDGMKILDGMFPRMKIRQAIKGATLITDPPSFGYLAVEGSSSAPNLNTKENELREILGAQGKEGMSLPTYLIAAKDSFDRTGHELDWLNTWTRLLGTQHDGKPVFATFRSGVLILDWRLEPHHNMPHLGGRSQRVI